MTTPKQRIEKAKKAYGVAESVTDSFLSRLMHSPYGAGIIVVAGLCVVGVAYWWFA